MRQSEIKINKKRDIIKSNYLNRWLNIALSIFEYKNLPKTIPVNELEKRLLLNGKQVFFKYKNNFFVADFNGIGQEESPYGLPTKTIVSIPALNLNQELTIDKDCVVINNDLAGIGISNYMQEQASQLLETDISLLFANYNSRIELVLAGSSDKTLNSANEFLEKIKRGSYGVISNDSFLDDLRPTSINHNTQNIDSLLSLHKYITSDVYNTLGIESLENLKKSRLITAELDTEITHPFIDNMLRSREDAIEKINNLFNLGIKVDLSSIWKQKETQSEQEQEENQSEQEQEETQSEQDQKETQSEQEQEENQSEQEQEETQSEQDQEERKQNE